MSSRDYSELMPLDKFSRIESAIKSTKDDINWAEINRIFSMLNSLKDDEDRLSKCIDDIEVFHRGMFVLPKKENKPADTENRTAMKDDMNETEYSVTEPECSRNEPMYSINEPDCSMNKQKSSRRSLILKIPKSIVYNRPQSMDEVDDSYGPSFSNNEIGDGKNESGDAKDESSCDMDESGDGKDESSCDMDESSYDMDESSYDMDESSYDRDESSDAEIEMAKKVLLNLLTDNEKEITELVLHLIYTFSCFQRKLQTADSLYTSTKFSPDGSNVNINRMLKDLSVSVLYLDKTVSNIYEKYSEMLESLGKIFE
ncbi:hypothetical protein AVEN_168400-1 [Araneus ventricosus]|uniref:Uncharacterized protein n=1 Tax=Araneus ventricosus TaxID=182803 RepID=A0A4Y2GQS8_ARAVE|nr:hypothetical protein AVEN_168400-1 [Araneus ventricosus]